MKILIVDDDRDLTDLLSFVLHRAAFRVISANDPASALQLLEAETPALVLLDARLGPSSGFDLLREIRRSSSVPVIMLTAMAREDDKVLAFELGADDYVTKPFSHRELIARIQARLKNPSTGAAAHETLPARVHFGSVTVDANDYSATRDGRPLKLTATEFRVLHCLLAQASTVVPTPAILKQVWGYDDPGVRDSLRVTIYRLRRKVEEDPSNPRLLITVPGVGFLLKVDADDTPVSFPPAPGVADADPAEVRDVVKKSATRALPGRPKNRIRRPRRSSSSLSGATTPAASASSLERRLSR
jgi:DNA-binding response OmpR family regulator